MEGAHMKTVTIGARISAELDRDLAKLSTATGRSKSWLVADALRSYVESEKAFVEAVEEGIKAYEEGKVVDHEAVVAELERRYRGA
jgi:RHH-type transcriptional regulator, rel operon repressor / antitoxin RelB